MHGKILVPVIALLSASATASAQTFNSGSTGLDGALDLSSVPAGRTVNFKPTSAGDTPTTPSIETALGRTLNWDDTRFDFTTITIPAGVRVQTSAKWTNGPIYWLATGAVSISGTVDLSGESGHRFTLTTSKRRPAIPGPGGYPGGMGGRLSAEAAQPGSGPGGGESAALSTWSYPTYFNGRHGTFKGSKFLVPLVGGSGGGGGKYEGDLWGGGGGAGGGAILIASSVSIGVYFPGGIFADGGAAGFDESGNCNNHNGGGGSGGAVRLAAPLLQGTGYVRGHAGYTCLASGDGYFGFGQVRLEAFQHAESYRLDSSGYSFGSPLNNFVPSGPPPAVTVFAIATNAGNQSLPIFLPENPTGDFDVADATINSGAPVTFEIRARGVPPGTFVDLYINSLEAADQVVRSATPLAAFDDATGRFTTSATMQVTLPPGLSRGYVRAKW